MKLFMFLLILQSQMAMALGDPDFIPAMPPDSRTSSPVEVIIDGEKTDQLSQEKRQFQEDEEIKSKNERRGISPDGQNKNKQIREEE